MLSANMAHIFHNFQALLLTLLLFSRSVSAGEYHPDSTSTTPCVTPPPTTVYSTTKTLPSYFSARTITTVVYAGTPSIVDGVTTRDNYKSYGARDYADYQAAYNWTTLATAPYPTSTSSFSTNSTVDNTCGHFDEETVYESEATRYTPAIREVVATITSSIVTAGTTPSGNPPAGPSDTPAVSSSDAPAGSSSGNTPGSGTPGQAASPQLGNPNSIQSVEQVGPQQQSPSSAESNAPNGGQYGVILNASPGDGSQSSTEGSGSQSNTGSSAGTSSSEVANLPDSGESSGSVEPAVPGGSMDTSDGSVTSSGTESEFTGAATRNNGFPAKFKLSVLAGVILAWL